MSKQTIRSVQKRIANGELRLRDLVAEHLSTIEKNNTEINAVTHLDIEGHITYECDERRTWKSPL